MKWWGIIVGIGVLSLCLFGTFGREGLAYRTTGSEQAHSLYADEEVEEGTMAKETGGSDRPLLTFSEDGVYLREFGESDSAGENVMEELGFESREEVLSMMTESPLVSLSSPLSADELARLFCLIVSLADEDAPLDARIERISFYKKEDLILFRAEGRVALLRFRKKYHMDFLPDDAEVSLVIPFYVKNAELSADYEEIVARFDGCDLPEMLLSCSYDLHQDGNGYKRLFAELVGNVIQNACFSG